MSDKLPGEGDDSAPESCSGECCLPVSSASAPDKTAARSVPYMSSKHREDAPA